MIGLRLVNAVGTEERLFLRRKVVPGLVELDIEAAGETGVAGAAVLLDLEEEGVAVAIDEPSQDPLRVAARLAFLPELPAGAAPVVHVAGFDGMPEGILVHPGHHEHTPAFLGALLNNGWNQSPVVVFEIQLHRVISEAGRILRKKNLDRGFAIAVRVGISEDQLVATATNAKPRYRYHEEAPETVTLPVEELRARLPAELIRADASEATEPGRMVGIPCNDLLAGNTPRISLGRLNDLLPDLVQIPEGRDRGERITLPPGWVALHFRLVTRREELAETEPSASIKEENDTLVIEVENVADAGNATFLSSSGGDLGEPVREEDLPSMPEIPAGTPELTTDRNQAQRRSLFESLPIFRRRKEEIPAVEPIREMSVEKVSVEKAEVIPSALPEPSSDPGSKALAVEPLWKLDPQDRLADPSALQALFMTEEKLTLERVISKAGELPGLKACVLAYGDQVLCTSNASTGIDLRTLSGQAMTMLAQIRESSAGMGLGAVPAVTLHAEQGALSFLHNGELCLLVLHADRGFIPGVRERLQEMMGHLSEAKPALPSPGESESR